MVAGRTLRFVVALGAIASTWLLKDSSALERGRLATRPRQRHIGLERTTLALWLTPERRAATSFSSLLRV